MHKSEPRANVILITHANKDLTSKQRLIGPKGVLSPSKSNYEINSTSYYKEST